MELNRIKEACNQDKKAETCVLLIDSGLAQLILLTDYLQIVKLRVEQTIPKKRKQSTTDYDKAMTKFYTKCKLIDRFGWNC